MKLFSNNPSKKRRLQSVSLAASAATTPSTPATQQQQRDSSLEEFRRSLPVFAYKKELVKAILHDDSHRVVLVVAETGSGKSTQIPAYLLSVLLAGSERIAVTQPRRVAAITLAERVATEHRSKVGREVVGYRVRFDDRTSYDTRIVYATDGMLLREAMVDPLLNRYGVIFLDEAHERSLQTDILLGVVQRARMARMKAAAASSRSSTPLRVVIMSATLDTAVFESFFGGQELVRTIRIPGRQFPVQALYSSQPVDDYVEATLATIIRIHLQGPDEPPPGIEGGGGGGGGGGDVLAFLPGQEDIEDVAALLRTQLRELQREEEQEQQAATQQYTGDRFVSMQDGSADRGDDGNSSTQVVNGVMICLLYAALPPEAQLAAFREKPAGCTRKVVLATNIAETSVTLPGIRYVVDCGKHKCRQISRATGMESLVVEDISRAQAAQRAGRAGRVAAGLCFRLYTEAAFDGLPQTGLPEILRVNLAQVVLQLKGMGISDPASFDFVTRPDRESLIRAIKLLFALSALDDKMELTAYGKKLAKLPLDPVFGHLLLQSSEYSCVSEMLTAVSVLSADNLFYRPAAAAAVGGGGGEGAAAGSGGSLSAARAAAAHRRFASHEGDLPTYLNVYQAWQNEAVYVPPSSGGRKSINKKLKQLNTKNATATTGRSMLSHGDWCQRNFVSGRALARAFHVRQQLRSLCERPLARNGLGMDVTLSCGKEREPFLKCVAAGLFLQVASRIKTARSDHTGKGRSGLLTSSAHDRGRYRTKVWNETVSIHPTSAMFGRNPAPACVAYTELVVTKKTYIRGVTQIREDWLHEGARDFYPK